VIDQLYDEPEETERRAFRREGLGYVYEPEGQGIRLRADYIEQGKGDITAEIVAESALPGVAQHLLRTRLNLLVDARLNDLAKLLSAAAPNAVGWLPVVRAFSEGVIRAERAGEEFQLVGNRPARLRPPDLVERILVSGKPTMLYGSGGVGKGYLSWGMAVCVQTGRDFAGLKVQRGNVLYLDWEDDDDEADERIKEVSRGFGIDAPTLHYRRMTTPLYKNIQRLAAYIGQHAISLLIVDSFELAAGGMEHGAYDEAAKRLYSSLRMLGPVSSLLIDHVSDQARQNKGQVNKAIGPLMKGNWARRSFEVKVDIADRINHCGLYAFKTNRGELSAPIGIAVDFTTPGAVQFFREDIRENPELSQALPMREQIDYYLKHAGPSTVKELSEVLGKPVNEIRTYLSRWNNKKFTKTKEGLWASVYTTAPTPIPLRPAVAEDEDCPF
jgi:hypothetical protein